MANYLYRVIVTSFIIAAFLLSGCGNPTTPTTPPKNVTVISQNSTGPFVTIEVGDIQILDIIGDPAGGGELRLFVIVTDKYGNSDGLMCPYNQPIHVQKGDLVHPCNAGISLTENNIPDEMYVTLLAVDEDKSNKLVDIGLNIGHEIFMAAVGRAAVIAAEAGFAALGVAVTATGPAVVLVAVPIFVSILGGELKEKIQEQDIIAIQVLRLRRQEGWNIGTSRFTTQDDRLEMNVSISYTSQPQRIVVLQPAPTAEPIVVTRPAQFIVITPTPELAHTIQPQKSNQQTRLSATIDNLRDWDDVPRKIDVTGKIYGLQPGMRAFLCIQSTAFRRYIWPQGEISPAADGSWVVKGIYASEGYDYLTYVVVTNNSDEADLMALPETRSNGMPELPPQTSIVSPIVTVTRK